MQKYYRQPYYRKPKSKTGLAFTLLIVCIIVLFSLWGTLGNFGTGINNIILGLFGLSSYAVISICIILCVRKISNKKLVFNRNKAMRYIPLILIGILAIHTITTRSYVAVDFSDYLKQCYSYGSSNAGGAVFGVITYMIFGWAGYSFTLAIFVIAFFSVAFISLYPLFLQQSNIKATKVTLNSRQRKEGGNRDSYDMPYDREPKAPTNTISIPSIIGKDNENVVKINNSKSVSRGSNRLKITFPYNDLGLDEETENNVDYEPNIRASNAESIKIYFGDNIPNPNKDKKIKPNTSIIEDYENEKSLIMPTVKNEYKEEAEIIFDKSSTVKPPLVDKKREQFTRGYMQDQIRKNKALEKLRQKSSTSYTQDFAKEEDRIVNSLDDKNKNNSRDILLGKRDEKNSDPTFEGMHSPKAPIRKTTIEQEFDKRLAKSLEEKENLSSSAQKSKDILYDRKKEYVDIKPQSQFENDYETLGLDEIDDLEITMTNKYNQSNKQRQGRDESSFAEELIRKRGKSDSPNSKKSSINNNSDYSSNNSENTTSNQDNKQESISPTAIYKPTRYYAPPIELLNDYPRKHAESELDHLARCNKISSVLAEYDIIAEVDNYISGAAVTRYEVTMPSGVSVSRVTKNSSNISMRLKSKNLRILAPIPGKDAVGFEIANSQASIVSLKEAILSKEFSKADGLTMLLGENVEGQMFVDDIAELPHALIAGSTGSGKSVFINTLLCGLLYKYSPDQLKLLLVDPKGVELNVFSNLPHMLVPNTIITPEDAKNALIWLTEEMERRFSILREHLGAKKIDDYNQIAKRKGLPVLPYIVVVIDEVADILMSNKKTREPIETSFKMLAQKSRAIGIHLILATQRPSVGIMAGDLKNNIVSRVAFSVPTATDSMTIIGSGGAEDLRGNGDMLYTGPRTPTTVRLQAPYISGEETVAVTKYIREHNECHYDESIENEIFKGEVSNNDPYQNNNYDYNLDNTEDVEFIRVLKFAIDKGDVSISALQRKFSIGNPKAGRFVEKMYELGYIEDSVGGNKPRLVLITRAEFEEIYGSGS